MSLANYKYILVISFFLGLIYYNKLAPRFIRFFIPFIFFLIFVELSTTLGFFKNQKSNHWFFNIATIIEFVFFYYIFYLSFISQRNKNWALFFIIILPVLFLINIFWIQGFYKFHKITYRIGSVFIIILCCFFFKQLLSSDKYIYLPSVSFFWISVGLLFFHTGFFVYYCAFDFIVYKKVAYNLVLWRTLSHSLNFLLYTTFLISFICHKTIRKY